MNCTICLGKYDKQMLLPTTCMPCCHNFCLTCLKELKKRDSKIICPECRQNVQSVKPCFEIIDLLEPDANFDTPELNVIPDANADLKKTIKEYSTELDESNNLFSSKYAKKLEDSRYKINSLNKEISNTAEDLIKIIRLNQKRLLKESQSLLSEITKSIDEFIGKKIQIETRTLECKEKLKKIDQCEQVELDHLKTDLETLKHESRLQINKIDDLKFQIGFKKHNISSLKFENSIGDIFFNNHRRQQVTDRILTSNSSLANCLPNTQTDRKRKRESNVKLISGSYDKTIKISDIESGECFLTIKALFSVLCMKLVFKNQLIVGLSNGFIKNFNLDNGECSLKQKGHELAVTCIELLPNNQIATGSADKQIKIWEIITLNCLLTLNGHDGVVKCLKQISNNQMISCSGDKLIKIWNLETGECVKTLEGHTNSVLCVDVLDDRIVTGSDDCTLKLWNLDSGDCIHSFNAHLNSVEAVKFIDRNRIISGSADETIKIWNLCDLNSCEKTFRGHTSGIQSLRFLSNDRFISSSLDETIKVWNVDTGVCVNTIEGHCHWVTCLELLFDD